MSVTVRDKCPCGQIARGSGSHRFDFDQRLEPLSGITSDPTTRSPAGKIVQVEIQQTNGVPTADIFSSPSLHHLSSSLGFLVVLDALSRRRGSFRANECWLLLKIFLTRSVILSNSPRHWKGLRYSWKVLFRPTLPTIHFFKIDFPFFRITLIVTHTNAFANWVSLSEILSPVYC